MLLIDLLGYGLSDKPDIAYTLALQADMVGGLTRTALGVTEVCLLTHDLGDTRGRRAAGPPGRRAMAGVDQPPGADQRQHLHRDGPPQRRPAAPARPGRRSGCPRARLIGEEGLTAGLAATFGPDADVGPEELGALWELVAHREGQRILPRLVRYIEERRRNERRFTGAIENHPSPLTVVWGTEDPIAVSPMVDRLCATRPGTPRVWLEGIGHYPMLEAPERFLEAVTTALG